MRGFVTVPEMRIFGPPGTGKTQSLTRQVARAADVHGTNRVLVASFTRAAAREVASRNEVIPDENIGTLHAFGYAALGRPKMVPIKDWNSHVADRHAAGGTFPLGWQLTDKSTRDPNDPYQDSPDTLDGDALLEEVELRRNRMQDPGSWPIHLQAFYRAWCAYKADAGTIDFCDMIEGALDAPVPHGAQVLFVDEAQDLTPLQLALVQRWGGQVKDLVLALDDDQAIYAWAGADPSWFFDHPIPSEHRRVLSESFRVPAAVHAFATEWVSQLSAREPKDYRPAPHDGEVTVCAGTWKRAWEIIDAIEEDLAVEGQTVMLIGAANRMLAPARMELRSRGIPFHNPYRPTRGDWNPLAIRKGSSILKLLAYFRPQHGDMWTRDAVAAFSSLLQADGVFQRGAKVKAQKLSGEDHVTVDELQELFVEEALEAIWRSDARWIETRLTGEARRVLEYPLTIYRERGAGALVARPRLTIGTVHSVKGGEADVVYVFPDLTQAAFEEWDGEDDHGHDAVIRLFYVAATRARRHLKITQPVNWRLSVPLEEFAA